jgi:thiol-disulfide isomerase/thioredoxin
LTQKKGWSASYISIGLIALVLLALIFLPELITKRQFSYDPGTSKATAAGDFPVETTLPIVTGFPGSSKTVSLKEAMAGNPHGALINFWATWCPPCLDELPALEYLSRQLEKKKDQLPVLITVSVDESPADVLKLYKTLEFQPSFRVLHDKGGELSQKMGTTKFPETYWISPEGKILHKWIGPQNWLSQDVVQKLASITQKS